jgi:putative peptidoglycan lipid II flippase
MAGCQRDSSRNSSQGSGSIARSARSVSIAVFLSRILGLVREQVLAGLFGAGTAMDAFVVAFRIPNLLRDLFAEGALSSAFVTVFSEYKERGDRDSTIALVNSVFTAAAIIISCICLVGMAFSEDLVRLMAPEFAQVPGKIEMARDMTIIMLPFLLMISMAALFMGLLNTSGYFFIPAFASACFNLGSIVAGTGLALVFPRFGWPAIYGMAIGTLIGGVMQMAVQLPLVIKAGYRLRPRLDLSHPGLRKMGRLLVPAIVGLSATQINIFINTNFASRCAEGSVAWLNYSFRLMFFPIGLFGVALSVATLPSVARLAARQELKMVGETLVSSLIMVFCLTIPATCGLWLLAEPIVSVIFQHGRFSAFDTLMTAQALKFYAIGLMAYSAVKIVVPVFYALNNARWPVIGSFTAVAANVVIILMTLDRFQHRAIALSTSLTIILNFLLLALVLYRKLGGYPIKRLLAAVSRVAAASALMSVAVFFTIGAFPCNTGLLCSGLKVALGMAVGISVYGGAIWFFWVDELRDFIKALLKRR